jgi:hypothetical protein
VNALHPGLVNTGLLNGLSASVISQAMPISEGVRTPVYLATSPEVEGVSGKYFFEQKPTHTSNISYNEEEQQKMWDHSMKLISAFLPAIILQLKSPH